MTPREEPAYLVSRIKEALAVDERTHMLAVVVEIHGSRVFLSGSASCDERRAAAGAVASELVGSLELVNAIYVEGYPEPDGTERLD